MYNVHSYLYIKLSSLGTIKLDISISKFIKQAHSQNAIGRILDYYVSCLTFLEKCSIKNWQKIYLKKKIQSCKKKSVSFVYKRKLFFNLSWLGTLIKVFTHPGKWGYKKDA